MQATIAPDPANLLATRDRSDWSLELTLKLGSRFLCSTFPPKKVCVACSISELRHLAIDGLMLQALVEVSR